MTDLCDICKYEIADEMSSHEQCEAEWNRRVEAGLCVYCGQEMGSKGTTHHECAGTEYLGYGHDGTASEGRQNGVFHGKLLHQE